MFELTPTLDSPTDNVFDFPEVIYPPTRAARPDRATSREILRRTGSATEATSARSSRPSE